MDETYQQVANILTAYFQREKKEKVERFRHLNRFAKPGQTVLAGSSLMEQFPIYEFAQEDALPCTVYNRGVGAFTTEELLENLAPCILELCPTRVFLNIGTNDLNGPQADVALLLQNIRAIIHRVREELPKTEITLLAFYPVNAEAADPIVQQTLQYRTNELLREVNSKIQMLAHEERVRFADLNEGLYDEQGQLKAEYTVDGIHMYADGYRTVLAHLLPLLVEQN